MIKSPSNRLKRISDDSFDFIIPFLVNQDSKTFPSTQKKFSVPIQGPSRSHLSMQMYKIYHVKKKQKVKGPKQRPKSKNNVTDSPNVGKEQLQLSAVNEISRVTRKNRFVKVHSLANHTAVRHCNLYEKQQSLVNAQDEFPIMGVRFRKKNHFLVESSDLITPQSNEELDNFKNQIQSNLKYTRQRKQWDKKRCSNVDSIINRNCKNFNDLISEYKRRLKIDQGSKVFIFDSKDLWLKRVLIDRGWTENINRQSRAFDLRWSNKLYKLPVFSDQLINHYMNSDNITSKTGLHKMLTKYGLTHLQPKTFDLATQSQEFIKQFNKIYCVSMLKKFLDKFEFEDSPLYQNLQQLKHEIIKLAHSTKQLLKYSNKTLQHKLLFILLALLHILQEKEVVMDHDVYEEVFDEITQGLQISKREQEIIRVLRDIHYYIRNTAFIENYGVIGSANIWLTKSKTCSRGVGIALHKQLDSITKHENRLAQKYIESPLIFKNDQFKGRKFDIRVWILVTGNTPSIYYHQKFYGRLCFSPYSMETINLGNQKMHLTNYTQNKYSFKQSKGAQSIILPERIFELIAQEMRIQYKSKFYSDIEKILKKLEIIFVNQLCKGSSGSFQLFGVDLLIDSELQLHLLQINLSARCEERHPALTDMLHQMGHGMMNILQNGADSQLHGWRRIK